MDLTASSAVNLPITSASLRLIVVSMGVRSIRRTYSGTRVPPRFTFTTNLVFFIVFHYFYCTPRNGTPVQREAWAQSSELPTVTDATKVKCVRREIRREVQGRKEVLSKKAYAVQIS